MEEACVFSAGKKLRRGRFTLSGWKSYRLNCCGSLRACTPGLEGQVVFVRDFPEACRVGREVVTVVTA
jgi:hypothetical protein